jgi:hypothetical protein
MLAKHIAQMFHVIDTTNKRLKVVMPGKQRIIGVENDVDEKSLINLLKFLLSPPR